MKAKDALVSQLPSLAGLVSDFLGFARELEDIQDAKESLDELSRELDEFRDVLKDLQTRAEFTRDSRVLLEDNDAYIRDQRALISEQLKEMARGSVVYRAKVAGDVTKKIGKIISRVQSNLLRLNLKLVKVSRDEDTIEKTLRPVSMAGVFTSQDKGCMVGTRKAMLAELLKWAQDPIEPPIFWLSGMAGVGKTAVAQSLCDLLRDSSIFPPSFFCSRRTSVNDHRDVMRIIPTLSALMARNYPTFMSGLLAEVSALGPDRDPLSLTLDEQFHLLLQKPLLNLTEPLPGTVLVIDALDELNEPHLTGEFLDCLLSVAESLPVKFLLTSRPEDQIRFRFLDRPSAYHRVLRLHDVESDIVSDDIRLYLTQKLKTIPRFHPGDSKSAVPQKPWPASWQLERLVELANNLFLYASTVVKYLKDEDPEKRLEILLDAQSTIATASLDDTYRFILRTAFSMLEPQEQNNRHRCLGTLVCARGPLSLQDMADLLDIDTSDVWAAFKPLHSVVQVPFSPTETISTFHISLEEFLTDARRSGTEQWFVSVSQTQSDLTNCCLRTMSRLQFNITHSVSSYRSNGDKPRGAKVDNTLSYACQYGVEHLARSQPLQSLLVRYGEVLCERFLYWLEVLSVLGSIDAASPLLMEFITAIDAQADFSRSDIRDFLRDGNEFVIRFQEPLSLSAPHVYVSALPFAPADSKIAQKFRHFFPGTLSVGESPQTRRQYPILVLRGHAEAVTSVAFSPDSARIISGSEDKTIRIWEARAGKELCQPLHGHTDWVTSVAFSPDSTRIVSASDDNTIRIWDTKTGRVMCEPLRGHTERVTSVAFSPDGANIVSGANDDTIGIWNSKTGKEICDPHEGHTNWVTSIAVSSDSTRIVSGSVDKTIRLWGAGTGQELCQPLSGHSGSVRSVAFSPDSTLIVSGASDKTIRIWSSKTGKEVCKPLTGHTDWVTSVAFSPDSILIVSGSLDNTIRIWDVKTGKEACAPLEGHTDWVTSVAFSPDGSRIISGSADSTIRVWDVRRSETYEPPAARMRSVEGIAYSEDSTCIIQTAWGKSARIWDAQTGKTRGFLELYRLVDSELISPESRRTLLRSDNTSEFFHTKAGNNVWKSVDHLTRVTSFALSPDSTRLICGFANNTIRVWDAKSGNEVCDPLEGHRARITCLAFSPDSKHIASGAEDNIICVWDSTTGKEACEPLEGHTCRVVSVAFSPDGSRVVSASDDNIIRVWDVSTNARDAPAFSSDSESALSVEQLRRSDTSEALRDKGPLRHDSTTGWVLSSSGERLFWVSPEFRRGFYWPRTTLVIGESPFKVDLTRFTHGTDWVKCYSGP